MARAGSKTLVTETPPAEMQAAAPERLTKYQRFVPGRISRSQLRNAPYNPRIIDAHAEKKLRAILKQQGLLEAITWNRRTGNLVGGHQRLAAIDALEGSPNYSMDVCIVDLSEADERKGNLTLNNPGIQGSYDPMKLLAMYEERDEKLAIDFESAGFDRMQIDMLFPESEKAQSLFAPPEMQRSELTRDTAHDLAEIDRIKDEKKKYRERAREDEDTEHHAVMYFKDRAHREAFFTDRGMDPDTKFVDAREVEAHWPVK